MIGLAGSPASWKNLPVDNGCTGWVAGCNKKTGANSVYWYGDFE